MKTLPEIDNNDALLDAVIGDHQRQGTSEATRRAASNILRRDGSLPGCRFALAGAARWEDRCAGSRPSERASPVSHTQEAQSRGTGGAVPQRELRHHRDQRTQGTGVFRQRDCDERIHSPLRIDRHRLVRRVTGPKPDPTCARGDPATRIHAPDLQQCLLAHGFL
jgi:hypothetical protein